MNNIILKGKKDRLIIQLNNEIDFETLTNSFKEKLKLAKDFFSSGEMTIEFSGRKLMENEENELLRLLQEAGINVTCILSEGFEVQKTNFLKTDLIDNGITKFHKGNLRSGDTLESEGNIVILGDVNPGAKIKAEGNIVVLGYLNGTAHAGGEAIEGAFITSLKMNPIQLRIGSKIARSPNGDMLVTNRVKKNDSLEVAYIKENKIIIENLNKDTLNSMIKF